MIKVQRIMIKVQRIVTESDGKSVMYLYGLQRSYMNESKKYQAFCRGLQLH